MNPAYVRHAVELIVADGTSLATVAELRGLLRRCGFDPIKVRDRPGFVINRVLMVAVN